MSRKMKAAPVFFTICQVRFNSILTLDSYAPKIQDRIRKSGFPDVQRGQLATLNLGPFSSTDEKTPQIPVFQSSRYIFSNIDKTSGFILDHNALSFQTTEYDVFDSFLERFLMGLDAVQQAVELSFIDRIGLRYIDAVFPKSGETLQDYLRGPMHGLSESFQNSFVHMFCETLIKAEPTNVRARAIIQSGTIGFPPDLHPPILNIGERFRLLNGLHAILDTDGWTESREAFNLESISKQFDLIHTEITKVFRATVTESALKKWE